MGRFVEISAAQLLSCLREVGQKVTAAGGHCEESVQGREVVFTLHHHAVGSNAVVRVYTTLTHGASRLRECDSDAMRVVVGVERLDKFKPLGKSRKILRTAPAGLPESERPQACLDRLVEAIREKYVSVKSVPLCPDCGAPMVLREPKKGQTFVPFFGCSDFPRCRGSLSR